MRVLMYVSSYSVSPAATNDRAEWRVLPTVDSRSSRTKRASSDPSFAGVVSRRVRPILRSAHSLTNQYGGFRVGEHLVCHTADQKHGKSAAPMG